MVPTLTAPTWRMILALLAQRLILAREEMENATTPEMLWRAQGKVQALRALQTLDQAVEAMAKEDQHG